MDSLLLRRRILQEASGGEPVADNILTFKAIEDNSSIAMMKSSSGSPKLPSANLEYSLDNGNTWNTFTVSTSTYYLNKVQVQKGKTIKFKGINERFCDLYGGGTFRYHWFVMTGKFEASGDITSILNGIGGDVELPYYGFYCMFKDCTQLVTAPNLPSTTLNSYCYTGLFSNCTALITAPKLPATILSYSCYSAMFNGCTSLEQAPILPSTTLTSYCYNSMFRDCTSLIQAPELPALSLVQYCYQAMFKGCSNLSYIKAMFTIDTYYYNTDNWLNGVAEHGIFIKNIAAEWEVSEENIIPSGWTVQTASE